MARPPRRSCVFPVSRPFLFPVLILEQRKIIFIVDDAFDRTVGPVKHIGQHSTGSALSSVLARPAVLAIPAPTDNSCRPTRRRFERAYPNGDVPSVMAPVAV